MRRDLPFVDARPRNTLLSALGVGLLFTALLAFQEVFSGYPVHLLTKAGIYVTIAISYNLINGVTGQFSLEPNAFVAIGAYTTALLTVSPAEKAQSFIIEPIIWPLSVIQMPLLPALIIAGLVTALAAFLMGFPVFRVRGDYLAIVTLGFGEVVRVVANNLQSVTNGPLGLKGIPKWTTLWWAWGLAVVAVFVIYRLVRSSFGRALRAIRLDETAAEAMGINAFWHKMLAFTLSAFFEGIAGGLLAHLLETIDPKMFTFFLTFELLIIIVVGGLGSTTGSIIAAVGLTFISEWLRVVEEPMTISWLLGVLGVIGLVLAGTALSMIGLNRISRLRHSMTWYVGRVRRRVLLGGTAGLALAGGALAAGLILSWLGLAQREMPHNPGMRMVIFSITLILFMIFLRQGLLGQRDFSWQWLIGLPARLKRWGRPPPKQPGDPAPNEGQP
jgi:branched-chain amino acid transport system permease protein